MRRGALFAVLTASAAAAGVVGGCTSHASSDRPEHSSVDSKSVPGLTLDLQELGDGESVPHPTDDTWRDHLQEVDTRSTLRLTFHPPIGQTPIAERPEWKRLDVAVARLEERLQEYRALVGELAERTARRGAEVAGYDLRVETFERRQRELGAGLADATLGPAPLTREELVIVAADPDGPWAGLAKWVTQQLADLSTRARASLAGRDDVLVAVRARLQPAVGAEQWLQVPGYWEKRGDLPATDTTRICSAETEQLRREYDAAQRLAAALLALRRTGDAIAIDLRRSVEGTRDRVVTRIRELVDARSRALPALLARAPQPRVSLPPAEQEFWNALATLSGELDAALAEWRALVSAASTRTPREQLADVVRAIDALERRRAAIEAALASLTANASAALAAAPDDLKPQIASLQHDLATSWTANLATLFAAPAETKETLAAARPLVEAGAPLLAAIDRLPADAANSIPRPPGELPPLDLDLRRQPIDPGDRLKLEIAFYDRDDFTNAQAQGTEAEPLETIRYSNLAMKSGWKWSGDLIFTQQLRGDNNDFSSTAAVSYEHHWRDRDEPRGFLNVVDPGIGFHAAALNFDPDVTAEFGMGVNASVLNGLIRAGVGYDVSISRDREYWFIGFGLVSTLEAVESLGEKAFGL